MTKQTPNLTKEFEALCNDDEVGEETKIVVGGNFDPIGLVPIGTFPRYDGLYKGGSAVFLNRTQVSNLVCHLQFILSQSNQPSEYCSEED